MIAPKIRKLFMIAIAIARSDVAEKGKQLDTTVRSEEREKETKNERKNKKKTNEKRKKRKVM